MSYTMNLLNRLFSQFHDEGILYCHWKSTEHLAATFQGKTDVDILVSLENRSNCESILVRNGFKRFETNFFRMYPGIYDYLGYDEQYGFIHFHLHYMLNVGDRWVKASNIPNVDDILNRRVWCDNYSTYLVNPIDELRLLDLRMLLKHGKRATKDKKIILERNWILNRMETEQDLKTEARVPYKSYPRFAKIGFLIVNAVRKYYRYYIEFSRRKLSVYSFGRRGLPGGGRIIALVGVDGSGKTTLLSELHGKFGYQMNTCMIYTGFGLSGSFGLRKLLYVLRKKKHESSRKNSVDNTGLKLVYRHYGLLLRKNRLRKIIKNYANGKLVLCDRWPQVQVDSMFDGKRFNVQKSESRYFNYLRRLEESVYSEYKSLKPHLVLKMSVSPENASNRKPEDYQNLNAVKYVETFESIVYNGQKVITLDANQSFKNVLLEAIKEIWQII